MVQRSARRSRNTLAEIVVASIRSSSVNTLVSDASLNLPTKCTARDELVVVVASPRKESSARDAIILSRPVPPSFSGSRADSGVSPPPFHRPAALITRHRGILSWKRETSAPRKFPHVSSPVSPVSSLPRLSINLFDSFSQFSFHSSPHSTPLVFPEIFRVIRRRRLSHQESIFSTSSVRPAPPCRVVQSYRRSLSFSKRSRSFDSVRRLLAARCTFRNAFRGYYNSIKEGDIYVVDRFRVDEE